jgi:hypothetical protein
MTIRGDQQVAGESFVATDLYAPILGGAPCGVPRARKQADVIPNGLDMTKNEPLAEGS